MLQYALHTDETLVALLKQGDEEAFAALYDRYWKRLFSVAANQLDNPAEAEELVQDLFVDLWSRRQQLDIRSLNNYLSVALNYKVINILARRSHRRRFENALTSAPLQQENAAEQWLSLEELQHRLAAKVAALPEQCRLVFTLSREDGLTRGQIADKLGIAEKTVEAHITKALRALRAAVGIFFSLFFHLH